MGITSLKTRQGAWIKAGRSSGKPGWPGSYRDYTYVRGAPAPYPKTAQQKKIGDKGRCVAKECKGKTGSAFKECLLTCVR
jgi:hypothetical protein